MNQRSDDFPNPRPPRERERNQHYTDSQRYAGYGSGDASRRRDADYRSESQYRSDPRYRDYRYGDSRYREFGDPWYAQRPFHEDSEPPYFGTGAQGHGGPGYTGGAYGFGDERPDGPRFEESDFRRGEWDRPFGDRTRQGLEPRRAGYWSDADRSEQPRRIYRAGPKGYQRSDQRLQEDISERLMEAYDIDCSDVSVQVQGGKVTLEGTVPHRYMKYAIEEVADRCAGVNDVDNRVRVTPGERAGE